MTEHTMTPENAAALRKPFGPNQIGLLPKGGAQLDFVGHAVTTDRLLLVDPEWTWEPVAFDDQGLPAFQGKNLWIRLTVCGVTRYGVGDGASVKECIGDAIRNAAMRFGVALDLWSKEELEQGAPKPGRKKAEPPPDAPPQETRRMSRPTSKEKTPRERAEGRMWALFKETNHTEKDDMLSYISTVTGRTIESRTDITDDELDSVVAELQVERGAS